MSSSETKGRGGVGSEGTAPDRFSSGESDRGAAGLRGRLEKWADVPGYEGLYRVSIEGQIKSIRAGRVLKPASNKWGHLQVCLHRNNKPNRQFVHRLVMLAFVGPCPPTKQVNHLNGIKADNRLENLEYVTQEENIRHAYETGLMVALKGEALPQAKITATQAMAVFVATGTYSQIGKRYGISQSMVHRIKKRFAWKHIHERKLSDDN